MGKRGENIARLHERGEEQDEEAAEAAKGREGYPI